MTQLIYHFFNKNRGGFKTHFTFSMELFVTTVYGFQVVAVVARSYLIDETSSWIRFLKKIVLRFKLSHNQKILTVYIL